MIDHGSVMASAIYSFGDRILTQKMEGYMYRTHFFERLMHLPRRIVRESIMVIDMVQLFLINRFERESVTQPDGPVVSLTTYGRRAQTVYLAIESIARGEMLPSRLILWIDELHLFNNLPASIHRLQKRGLEVRLCKNYGPHKKYYPYVESQDHFDLPLVTVDDDFVYPRYWLKKLIEANREYPDVLNCYWAKSIAMNENGFEKYRQWKDCRSTNPSFRHLALCGGGAIFPPRLLTALRSAGGAFEACCPKGDDLWLHVQSLRSGYKVRQILPPLPYFSFQGIPGANQTALSYENVTYGDGNDRQIAATYKEADVQLLQSEGRVAFRSSQPMQLTS